MHELFKSAIRLLAKRADYWTHFRPLCVAPPMGLRIAVFLPLVASLGLSCQLERKKQEQEKTEPTPVAEETPTPYLKQLPIPLDLWPAATTLMVGFDVPTIKQSPLGNMFEGILLKNGSGAVPSDAPCQKRYLESLDAILLLHGFADQNAVGVMHGIKRDEVENCVAADATSAARQFGANYGTLGDDLEKNLIYWHDSETLLIAIEGGKAALDRARPDKLRAPTNPVLLNSLKRVDTSAAIWMSAVVPPAGMSKSVEEFRGSIQLKVGLNASFRVHYDKAESATASAEDVKLIFKNLAPTIQYFEGSNIRTEGKILMYDLALSRSRVEEFSKDPMLNGAFSN